jgi:hypothetical protein
MLMLNGVMSLLAALGLAFVVLHPAIHEGLAIKGGMITMIFSLLASTAVAFSDEPSATAAFNAGISLRVGILIVCVGYAFKYRKAKRCGGSTDFGPLTEHTQ